VLVAHQWASDNDNAETNRQALERVDPRGHIFFLVDTLEYLQKGGRIGGAKALLGEMLRIKPILCLDNGQVEPFRTTNVPSGVPWRGYLKSLRNNAQKHRMLICASCRPMESRRLRQ